MSKREGRHNLTTKGTRGTRLPIEFRARDVSKSAMYRITKYPAFRKLGDYYKQYLSLGMGHQDAVQKAIDDFNSDLTDLL